MLNPDLPVVKSMCHVIFVDPVIKRILVLQNSTPEEEDQNVFTDILLMGQVCDGVSRKCHLCICVFVDLL